MSANVALRTVKGFVWHGGSTLFFVLLCGVHGEMKRCCIASSQNLDVVHSNSVLSVAYVLNYKCDEMDAFGCL